MTREKHYACRYCYCYLITWMKAEKRYTADELRAHLREVHRCTPSAVEDIMRIWSSIDWPVVEAT